MTLEDWMFAGLLVVFVGVIVMERYDHWRWVRKIEAGREALMSGFVRIKDRRCYDR